MPKVSKKKRKAQKELHEDVLKEAEKLLESEEPPSEVKSSDENVLWGDISDDIIFGDEIAPELGNISPDEDKPSDEGNFDEREFEEPVAEKKPKKKKKETEETEKPLSKLQQILQEPKEKEKVRKSVKFKEDPDVLTFHKEDPEEQEETFMKNISEQLDVLINEDVVIGVDKSVIDTNTSKVLKTKSFEIVRIKPMPEFTVSLPKSKNVGKFTIGDSVKGKAVVTNKVQAVFLGVDSDPESSDPDDYVVHLVSLDQRCEPFIVKDFKDIQKIELSDDITKKLDIKVFGNDEELSKKIPRNFREDFIESTDKEPFEREIKRKYYKNVWYFTKVTMKSATQKAYSFPAYWPHNTEDATFYPGDIVSLKSGDDVSVQGILTGGNEKDAYILSEGRTYKVIYDTLEKVEQVISAKPVITKNVIKISDLLEKEMNDTVQNIAMKIFIESYNQLVPNDKKEVTDPGIFPTWEKYFQREFERWCSALYVSYVKDEIARGAFRERVDQIEQELRNYCTLENLLMDFVKNVGGPESFTNGEVLLDAIKDTYTGHILVISSLVKLSLQKLSEDARRELKGDKLYQKVGNIAEKYLHDLIKPTQFTSIQNMPYDQRIHNDFSEFKRIVGTETSLPKIIKLLEDYLQSNTVEPLLYLKDELKDLKDNISDINILNILYAFYNRGKYFRVKAEQIFFEEQIRNVDAPIAMCKGNEYTFGTLYKNILTEKYYRDQQEYNHRMKEYNLHKTDKSVVHDKVKKFAADCNAQATSIGDFLTFFFIPVFFMRNIGAAAYANYFKTNFIKGKIDIAEMMSLPLATFFPEFFMNKKLYETEKYEELLKQLQREITSITYECLSEYISRFLFGKFEHAELYHSINWKKYLVVPQDVCENDSGSGDVKSEDMVICYDPAVDKFTCHQRQELIQHIKEGKINPHTKRPYPQELIDRVNKILEQK
ncbi:MAG TPA: hypothetical protein VLE02_01760 [Nitrosarchaeum sp.]|nr:hypothetical protein [Nitrosarchaeum sp.]